jgi:tripartite-type tricarboxylate transporter receptor subunit TctC
MKGFNETEKGAVMDQIKCPENKSIGRREFMKIAGYSTGIIALGLTGNSSVGFARELYPTDKITLIVPHGVGGGHDIYARGLIPYLTRSLKEVTQNTKSVNIVMKNEPAAGGRKGLSQLFNAPPDGYTIGLIESGVITDNVVAKLEDDYAKYTFLALATSNTKMIVTSKKRGFNSWDELITAMKKEPVKLAVGSYGRTNHVSGIIINEKMGTRFKLIPTIGTAESMNAVMRGDMPVAFVSSTAVKGLINAGEIKALLVLDETTEYPGSVTSNQLGFSELNYEVGTHNFIIAPPGLPEDRKEILVRAIKKATTDREFVAWAKKKEIPLKNVYGADAQKMFQNFVKFYEGIAPILKKQLT